MKLTFRLLAERDLPAVLEIEQGSFPDPWSEDHFRSELSNRHSRVELAFGDGVLLGYIVYWTVVDEVEILDVAVSPNARRQGHGRSLVRRVLEHATNHECRFVSLEARRSNTTGIALYESLGFEAVGIRRNYYASDGEDAVVMRLSL